MNEAPNIESLRGAKPLLENPLPLSFEGEGDTGGEVDKIICQPSEIIMRFSAWIEMPPRRK